MIDDERRNDIGQKIFIGLILAVCGLLGGLFVNDMFDQARIGTQMANDNKVAIANNSGEIKAIRAEMMTNFATIKSDLVEIKSLLRRAAPYEIKDGKHIK